jgi:hypothetical protein
MIYKVTIERSTFTLEDCQGPSEAIDRALAWWVEEGGDPKATVSVEVA